MTSKEWLGVMQQAADYNPEMTSLIKKYGEMLVNEKLAEIELEKIRSETYGLPIDFEKYSKSLSQPKKQSLMKRIMKRTLQGFVGSLCGMIGIYILGVISFMLPIGFLNSLALTIVLSLTMGFGIFAYFDIKSEDKNKSKKQIL